VARPKGESGVPPDAQSPGARLEISPNRDAREFWEQHDTWEQRIELARKDRPHRRSAVLANEAPIAALRTDAWIKAGEALRRAERHEFALEHLQHGMESDPRNLRVLREMGICLQRLALAGAPGHSIHRARQHYRNVLEIFPDDAETWALASGRVDKDAWTAAWDSRGRRPRRSATRPPTRTRLLRAAIDSYSTHVSASSGKISRTLR